MCYDTEKVVDDIILSFIEKIDTTKINNDCYIINYIEQNLHNEIMENIYNKLLSMDSNSNEKIIKDYQINIYSTIKIYKKYFDDYKDLIDYEEIDFYAKLALSLIYDDFMTIPQYKDDILIGIKKNFNDSDDEDYND